VPKFLACGWSQGMRPGTSRSEKCGSYALVSDGVFSAQGEFLPLPALDAAAVIEAFRRLLLERLRQAERLSESLFPRAQLRGNQAWATLHRFFDPHFVLEREVRFRCDFCRGTTETAIGARASCRHCIPASQGMDKTGKISPLSANTCDKRRYSQNGLLPKLIL